MKIERTQVHFFSDVFSVVAVVGILRSRKPLLCAACCSVVQLHAARVFDYFVVTEIAFMDNQAQITETTSRLYSEKVS